MGVNGGKNSKLEKRELERVGMPITEFPIFWGGKSGKWEEINLVKMKKKVYPRENFKKSTPMKRKKPLKFKKEVGNQPLPHRPS